MRQVAHTMFISDSRASLHLKWKENLVKHQTSKLFSCSSEEISIRILSNIYHGYQLKIVRVWNFLVSIFHIWTEYWCISPYSLRMRGNADQKNSFCYSKNIFEVILEFKVLSYLQFSKKTRYIRIVLNQV